MTKRIYGKREKKAKEDDTPDQAAAPESRSGAEEPVRAPAKSRRERRCEEKQGPKPLPLEMTAKMTTFQRVWRCFGLFVVTGLGLSILGSSIATGKAIFQRPDWVYQVAMSIMLLVFNILIVFPIVFESWRVSVDQDGLEIRNIFWLAKLEWDDVVDFKNPHYLKLALLRTRKCFYFLNKRSLSDYETLEAILLAKKSRFGKIPTKAKP